MLQRDDDLGSLGRELSEDEYDALNDETFTRAVRDDWEGKETLLAQTDESQLILLLFQMDTNRWFVASGKGRLMRN